MTEISNNLTSAIKNHRFSVIIPTLGERGQLGELLESLTHQDYPNTEVEILIVVHQSHHANILKLKSRFKSKTNVQFYDFPMKGANAARNFGSRMAQHEWLLFLDDDCDLSHGHYLKSLNQIIKDHPEVQGYGGCYLSETGSNLFDSAYNGLSNNWVLFPILEKGLSEVLLGGCCVYNRQQLLAVDGFNESHQSAGEEIDLSQKFATRIKLMDELSVFHRPKLSVWSFYRRALNHGGGPRLTRSPKRGQIWSHIDQGIEISRSSRSSRLFVKGLIVSYYIVMATKSLMSKSRSKRTLNQPKSVEA